MKTLKIILVLLYFIAGFPNAQIDTTDWFPMHTGNYWEYWDNSGSGSKLYITIVGDTVLDNGHSYNIFRYRGNNWLDSTDYYFRKEDNCKVFGYYDAANCTNKEQLLYDFCLKDSVLWPSCLGYLPDIQWFRTVLLTDNIYLPLLQNSVTSKLFSDVIIDTAVVPNDTSWFAGGLEKIAKGIGKYESLFDQSPWYYLVGAIINNQQYGLITNIETNYILTNESENLSLSVYPNPFNSQCRVIIKNPKISHTVIIVYNSLGQKLFELTKEINQNNNIYQFELDLSEYPTGVYFLRIMNSFEVFTTKIINMK